MAAALTTEQIQALSQTDRGKELLRRYHAVVRTPLQRFRPRPDNLAEFDQQTSFLESKASFSICLGGTGSGKTEVAAVKTARYLLGTKPFRPRCPFWVVGDTYETVCATCWDEKLSKYIPPGMIYHVDWYRPNRNWPFAVTLRDPDNPRFPGWVIEFKSYSQGFATMKARSIGGYWFNEEVPLPIVKEVQGRCRDYNSPGWADFTPIEVVSPEWPERYDDPPEGWKFFHLNVEKNRHIDPDWLRQFLDSCPEEERETRRIGVFATYTGMVFKEWRKSVHVVDEFPIPADWKRIRGIDFGFNNPFCCLWVARDHDGAYWVYDEHYAAQQLNTYHAEQINRRYWDYSSPYCRSSTFSDHDAQQRAELQSLGIRCTPALKSDKGAHLRKLRGLMKIGANDKPRLFVFSKCKNLIREIRGYRYPEGTDTRNPNDLPLDKDDHAIDALLYAVITDMLGRTSAPQPTRREWQPRDGIQLSRKYA